jgi:hypothetical protein
MTAADLFFGRSQVRGPGLGVEARIGFPEKCWGPRSWTFSRRRADIVISHTAPRVFEIAKAETVAEGAGGRILPGLDLTPDPSEEVLDEALHRLQPSHWYFGHHHWERKGETAGCRWHGLADLTRAGAGGRHWVWLPDF